MLRETQLVPPGIGTTWRVIGGDIIVCKVTGKQTGGSFALFETTTPPRCGTPPHVHHREDETFYVISGTYDFHVAGKVIRAEKGAVVMAPKDIPHFFQNIGNDLGRLLIIAEPAGIEDFFAEFSKFDPDAHPDLDRVKAVADKYGIEILVP